VVVEAKRDGVSGPNCGTTSGAVIQPSAATATDASDFFESGTVASTHGYRLPHCESSKTAHPPTIQSPRRRDDRCGRRGTRRRQSCVSSSPLCRAHNAAIARRPRPAIEAATATVAKRSSWSEPSGDRIGPAHPLTFAEVEQAPDPPLAGSGRDGRIGRVAPSVRKRLSSAGLSASAGWLLCSLISSAVRDMLASAFTRDQRRGVCRARPLLLGVCASRSPAPASFA